MIFFDGNYNPEQWPKQVWADDVELVRCVHLNLVTVGVFSWSRLQPAPEKFDFGWLDRVLDKLTAAGIGVCLALPAASLPSASLPSASLLAASLPSASLPAASLPTRLTGAHPDAMPVTRDGVRLIDLDDPRPFLDRAA